MAEEYLKDINQNAKVIYDGNGHSGIGSFYSCKKLPSNKLVKSVQMISWN